MRAMVLAAGLGTRLHPVTDQLPKALVPVAGRPMIEYALCLLRYYGIHEIMINLHHHGGLIKDHLGNGYQLGIDITYSEEAELLDTGGGLLKAKPFLQKDTFIVINTDVLIDLHLDQLLAFHRQHQAASTLVLRPDPTADDFGSMDIDDNGRISRFLVTTAPCAAPSALRKLMFTGVQVLEPRVFDFMDDAETPQRFSTTKQTYPRMLSSGEPLYGFTFKDLWQDLGTAERIKAAEKILAGIPAGLHYI